MGLNSYMQKQAASFPVSIIEYKDRQTIMASNLLEAGITSFDGAEVIPGQKYTTDVLDVKQLNHFRMLKTFRRRYGTEYAREYVAWFIPHHARMIEKYPKYFDKKQKSHSSGRSRN